MTLLKTCLPFMAPMLLASAGALAQVAPKPVVSTQEALRPIEDNACRTDDKRLFAHVAGARGRVSITVSIAPRLNEIGIGDFVEYATVFDPTKRVATSVVRSPNGKTCTSETTKRAMNAAAGSRVVEIIATLGAKGESWKSDDYTWVCRVAYQDKDGHVVSDDGVTPTSSPSVTPLHVACADLMELAGQKDVAKTMRASLPPTP